MLTVPDLDIPEEQNPQENIHSLSKYDHIGIRAVQLSRDLRMIWAERHLTGSLNAFQM